MRAYFLILFSLFSSVTGIAGSTKHVLVYNGTGVCAGCPEDIADQLRKAGYDVSFANEHQVTLTKLKQYDLYIQPGGDDVGTVKKALRSSTQNRLNGLEAIQRYVSEGGNFLGLCLGAFMADSTLEDDHTQNLHLIAAAASPHTKTLKARMEYVSWQHIDPALEGRSLSYFQGGPQFKIISPDKNQGIPLVLASYGTNDGVAAVMNSFGRGKAMALGIHPEATNEWLKLDHLRPAPEAVAKDQKIFLSLIETLLQVTPRRSSPANASVPEPSPDFDQGSAK